jgi:hypothetical protein
MQIVRLKFADAHAALVALAVYCEDAGCTLAQVYPRAASGEFGADGEEEVAMAPGYYIDILARDGVDLAALSGWTITPETPQHGFAGIDA